MKSHPNFLNKPVGMVIATGLIIGMVELLIMASISIASDKSRLDFWDIADPFLLVAILSPMLYCFIFRPLREQQIDLEQTVRQRTQALELATVEVIAREALLSQIIETITVGISLADERGVITQTNQAMATLFGSSKESLIGRDYLSLVHPVDVEAAQMNINRLGASVGVTVMDVDRRYIKNDQTEFWGFLSGRVAQREGTLERVFVFSIMDVTERKRAEEATRIAATAFESQQGMTITDSRGTILQVNKAFTKITGYSADEVIGKNPRLLQSGRQDAAFYKTMWESIRRDGSWQGEVWNKRKDGVIYPEWLNLSAVKNDIGTITHFVGAFSDSSEYKAAEQRIENLAFYDPLTGLPNRALLTDRLHHALAATARHQRQGALMLIDLDNFKIINDTLGHEQGDLLIKQVAMRLRSCVRESDTLARVGGDEFAILFEGASQNDLDVAQQAKVMGDKILAVLHQPYQFSGVTHHSTASIGVTLIDGTDQDHLEQPLKQAELAMYQAKTAGRDTLRFFDPQMQAVVSERADLESLLREAVAKNQFLLHYQPQINSDNLVIGAEALVRWRDPIRGMISPGDFIPVAEDSGLILPLGQWVLETACSQLVFWAAQPTMAHLTLAINVSARQFHQTDFVQQVLATLASTGANPQRLKLELTESMLVDDIEGVIAKMNALKGSGVSFSLDDFGTGYSSLAYLKRLPLDQLKIDQGFVRDILVDPNDAAIVKAVIALSDAMGLSVIAEGVETEAHRDRLIHLGCPAYQGYFFSKPLPLEEFVALLNHG